MGDTPLTAKELAREMIAVAAGLLQSNLGGSLEAALATLTAERDRLRAALEHAADQFHAVGMFRNEQRARAALALQGEPKP